MEQKKKKIVWLCAFSDEKLRAHLNFNKFTCWNLIRRAAGRTYNKDFAVWNTNAIAEYEKLGNEFEIHVVAPHAGISGLTEFEDNGIFYHIFWSEWDIVLEMIKRRFNKRDINSFKNHRKIISKVIRKIRPDLVHVTGIENNFYAMAVLDLPKEIPVISMLQTLVTDKRFRDGFNGTDEEYSFDSEMEKRILMRSQYIATKVPNFREIITRDIKPNAEYLDMTLALTEPTHDIECEKKFDFVYFAAGISKAADWAIEAFIIASQKQPGITLDVVGGYSEEYKQNLVNRLTEFNLQNNVVFEGKLTTHEDVLQQIRYSKFALLPIKQDFICGTIRESMANGIPVITTVTPGTPTLNKNKLSVLLSEPGDFNAMAENMLLVLNSQELALTLKNNAMEIASASQSNYDIIREWVSTYKTILYK